MAATMAACSACTRCTASEAQASCCSMMLQYVQVASSLRGMADLTWKACMCGAMRLHLCWPYAWKCLSGLVARHICVGD